MLTRYISLGFTITVFHLIDRLFTTANNVHLPVFHSHRFPSHIQIVYHCCQGPSPWVSQSQFSISHRDCLSLLKGYISLGFTITVFHLIDRLFTTANKVHLPVFHNHSFISFADCLPLLTNSISLGFTITISYLLHRLFTTANKVHLPV